MSAIFELAVIRPVVDAELLRDAVVAAVKATGWNAGSSDVWVFAYRLTPNAVIVEHRATRSPYLGDAIEGSGAIINPFEKYFYVELGARRAPWGSLTLAAFTSHQIDRWAVYAIDRDGLAAYSRRPLTERLLGFGRRPPAIYQDGHLDPDSSDTAAQWLSSALDITPPLPNMAKFHDWMLDLWYSGTLEQWLGRILLQHVQIIRSGRILAEPENFDAREFLRDEAIDR
jgi:hypothetical protein